MRINANKNMRGFSVLNLLLVAIAIVFVITISMNLVPPYLHDYAIQDALEELAANPELTQMSKAKMHDLFVRKMQVNYISNVSPDSLVIDKKGDNTYLSIKYEVRTHLIANIDAVVMFEHEVKVEKASKS